jgi:hypothetical protein
MSRIPYYVRIALGIVLLLSVIGLYLIKWYYGVEDNDFGAQFASVLFQVIGVVGLGGLVSFSIAHYTAARATAEREAEQTRAELVRREDQERIERHRIEDEARADRRRAEDEARVERRRIEEEGRFERLRIEEDERARRRMADDEGRRLAENRNQFRKQVLARLDRAYAATKRARRLLRATACVPPYYGKSREINPQSEIQPAAYDAQMSALNDAQLELEGVVKDVRANSDAIERAPELADRVSELEDALNHVISEWENERGTLAGTATPRRVDELPMLRGFIGPAEHGDFRFLAILYQDATRLLRAEMLHPTAPSRKPVGSPQAGGL